MLKLLAFLFWAVVIAFIFVAIAYFFGMTVSLVTFFVYLGLFGTNWVPIGHKGVPLFMGGRLLEDTATGQRVVAIFEVPEGLIWLPPRPFMGEQDVDVREQTVNVPEFTVISSNAVRVTIRPSVIRFRIDNPGQSLSVGMSTIQTGSRELVQNIIRSEINGMDDATARQATNQVRDRVKEEADRKADDWGVKVTEILIGEVALPESVQRDYERIVREQKQMEAETIELNHVAARISDMTGTLVRAGLPAERAADRASEIVQRERGKAAIAEQRIAFSPETIEAMGPFVKAIIGKPQRKSKKETEGEEDESV